MEKERKKGILPNGSYQRIADAIGKSEGLVRQYFSNVGSRVSLETELCILEQAEKIVKEDVLAFIRAKKRLVSKKLKVKAAMAA